MLELTLHDPLFALELCRRNTAVEHPIGQQLQGRAPMRRRRVNVVCRVVHSGVGIGVVANLLQDATAVCCTPGTCGAAVDKVLEEM